MPMLTTSLVREDSQVLKTMDKTEHHVQDYQNIPCAQSACEPRLASAFVPQAVCCLFLPASSRR